MTEAKLESMRPYKIQKFARLNRAGEVRMPNVSNNQHTSFGGASVINIAWEVLFL